MKKLILTISALTILTSLVAQQPKMQGVMKEGKPGYFQNTIMKDVRAVDENMEPAKTEKRFQADLSGMKFPNKISYYNQEWHLPPVSQGNTNTCWCFSATSFFESEVHRLTGQEIKLSEMYTVYWEYVERAKRCVIHYATPALQLIPFCVYNMFYRQKIEQQYGEALVHAT